MSGEQLNDQLLVAFLNEYTEVFLVDLEADTVEEIHAQVRDDLLRVPFWPGSCFTQVNRVYREAAVDPDYWIWHEQNTTIADFRRVLRKRPSYTLAYPLKNGTWEKIDVRLLENKIGVPWKALICRRIPDTRHGGPEDTDIGIAEVNALSGLRNDLSQGFALSNALAAADVVATYEVDVTDDMILSSSFFSPDIFWEDEGKTTPYPLSRSREYWAGRIQSDNRNDFCQLVDAERLISLYETGERDPLIQYMVRDRFGNEVWLRESITLTRDVESGHIKGMMILSDMTERIRIARENSRRLDMIDSLTRSFETVYFADLDHNTYDIYRTNNYFLTRYSSVFVPEYDRTVELFAERGVYEKDQEIFRHNMDPEVIRQMLRDRADYSFTFRGMNFREYYRCQVARLGQGTRHISEVMIGFANIQNEKNLERQQREQLEQALEQARQADKAKSTFLSNMSHDIRTPMNAIIGFASIAESHIDEKKVVRNSLEKITASGTHLLRLINDVLDMSRIESGEMTLRHEENSLREIINSALDIIEPSMEKKNITMVCEIDPKMPDLVYCDKLRLTQVLLNLLSNANKYTPEGGRVALKAFQSGMSSDNRVYCEFHVIDNGIGMSDDFQNKIFEPFERENNTTVSRVAGTGLGMPIVKAILDAMDGMISVRSRQGEGTEFIARFALELQKNQEDDFAWSDGKGKLTKYCFFRENPVTVTRKRRRKGYKQKILLVEDNYLNREIAVAILEDAGYRVDTAVNGEVAVTKVMRAGPGGFDAVLMDLQMPIMNGYEATRAIRRLEDPEVAGVPIIAITADAFDEDMRKCMEAGMNAYIAKPVEVSALRSILKTILNT